LAKSLMGTLAIPGQCGIFW